MEEIVDKIVAELEVFAVTPPEQGGMADLMTVAAVYWGDPGVMPVNAYPCFTAQPTRDIPDKETTSYEVRDNDVLVTLLIDARAFFNATPLEATGDRVLVQAMERARKWFRRDSNRSLDGLTGVREVKVPAVDYNVQVRGAVIAKAAQMTLRVNQQRARQE